MLENYQLSHSNQTVTPFGGIQHTPFISLPHTMESWFKLSQELAHLKRVVINTRKNDVLRRKKNPLILYVTN